jgi:hypothetical protein
MLVYIIKQAQTHSKFNENFLSLRIPKSFCVEWGVSFDVCTYACRLVLSNLLSVNL